MEINKIEELQEKISKQDFVMIYFYTDLCGPCKSLRPKVIEMKENNFPKMELYFVNSINIELRSYYNVFDSPTILLFIEGKEYLRESKYVSISQLGSSIERYYNMIF